LCHVSITDKLSDIIHQVRMLEKQSTPIQANQVLREGLDLIRNRLPAGWTVEQRLDGRAAVDAAWDAQVTLRAPSGEDATLPIEAKTRVYPSALSTIIPRLQAEQGILIAPFIPSSVRKQLKHLRGNFADLTGNVRLELSRPGLFIETTGAIFDPSPIQPQRSLKAAQASRVIRSLIDNRPPYLLGDIATRAGVDAGHVSRLLKQLEQEGLLSREPRGPVTEVKWEELLRRWAEEYRVTKSNAATYLLEPRGIGPLLEGLRGTALRYALTGSVAASMRAAVAPARLAMLYVEDPRAVASELKLRPAAAGGNVVLLVPKDPLPFEGAVREQGLVMSAPSQVAADLLTGPGRTSSEADVFIDWMKENEDAWRR
jgi:hypothetical protein